MTWSYSRIKCFDDCPYRFYLKYIRRLKGKEMFFSSYGTFIHKLIEQHYKEGKTPTQMCDTYICEFANKVQGEASSMKVFTDYFESGLRYLQEFKPLPYEPLAIEKRVKFSVGSIPFVGVIDFLGEKDGELYIVDHKSRKLKPRSKRAKPTKTDEELDSYLVQLYLYAAAIEQECGRLPEKLCFNCFREQRLIEEPFKEEAYKAAQQWLVDKVAEIAKESDFKPSMDYFKCKYLCEMQDECDFYELNNQG